MSLYCEAERTQIKKALVSGAPTPVPFVPSPSQSSNSAACLHSHLACTHTRAHTHTHTPCVPASQRDHGIFIKEVQITKVLLHY